MLFALFYFYAYSHLRFKHTILGTHLSCLFRKMSLYFLSVVGDREEGVVALQWAFKNTIWVGAGTEM